jgi:tetratricopeptide (TPR) repeat protein
MKEMEDSPLRSIMAKVTIDETQAFQAHSNMPEGFVPVSVRSSPVGYLSTLFVFSFFSAFLVYLDYFALGLGLFVSSLLVFPILVATDRIVFDGRRLRRTGLVPRLVARLFTVRDRLKISDIEWVETHSLRAFKRRGNVVYRYRTAFLGKGLQLVVASGGKNYRKLLRAILPKLPEAVLDNKTIELRDYLNDPSEVRLRANELSIPSGEMLDMSFRELWGRKGRRTEISKDSSKDETVSEKVSELRKLGNELKLSGSLVRAAETFRRAVRLSPTDGWLLFDFSRCLQSFAGSERDARLERRARAMLRLAERRAGNDGELLARIGENYFQIGEWRRAGEMFKRAVDLIGENFRSLRGLAEIALREGKIAHVIHNFAAAHRIAETPSIRRWTQAEVDYFSRLNEDDEYMELEVSRVNLLDSLERWKQRAIRVATVGLPIILIGVFLNDSSIANVGWTVSLISLVGWVLFSILRRTLEKRIPFEALRSDN